MSVSEGVCGFADLLLSFLAGGPRVLHPWPVLSDVHVRWRVGHAGPQHPSALLSSLEVRLTTPYTTCMYTYTVYICIQSYAKV